MLTGFSASFFDILTKLYLNQFLPAAFDAAATLQPFLANDASLRPHYIRISRPSYPAAGLWLLRALAELKLAGVPEMIVGCFQEVGTWIFFQLVILAIVDNIGYSW